LTTRLLHTFAAAETEAAGANLAAELQPGDIVLLEGDHGAGKTTFDRGACRALGVTQRVTSPTFAIGNRYHGQLAVSHLDLYRLGSLADEEGDVLGDYLEPDAVAFVEWPGSAAAELAAAAAGRVIRVRIEHDGEDRRTIEIYGRGVLRGTSGSGR
jgi:tRNA threonylcarbamoyladenosine biosynthesis protein TsaE